MSDKFFEHIEGDGKPQDVPKKDGGRPNPFERLEVGENQRPLTAPLPPLQAGVLCPHCRQANDKSRDKCWACFKPLRAADKAAPPEPPKQEITLVLDGFTYHSTDAGLPADVQDLFARIQARGYSEKLMEEWRRSRRSAPSAPSAPPTVGSGAIHADLKRDGLDVEVLEGRRRSFIKIGDKTYTSDDPSVPPEVKRFFDHLGLNGVTPQLMDELRRFAKRIEKQDP